MEVEVERLWILIVSALLVGFSFGICVGIAIMRLWESRSYQASRDKAIEWRGAHDRMAESRDADNREWRALVFESRDVRLPRTPSD